jgi:predicted RNase H-like HicB family nuclease
VSIRHYTAAVYEAEEGGFWAEVLDLPGCVAQGENIAELETNIRDAIEAWEETRRELDGAALPRRVYTLSVLADIPDGRIPA